MSRSGIERRLGRLSRQGTSEELPELKEVAEEERNQIPVVTVEDVEDPVDDSSKNKEEDNGGKRKTKEEEAAERERKAQRQSMAIQELVDTERNYLKHLQICTVTIRRNLEKLQVDLLLTVSSNPYHSQSLQQQTELTVCMSLGLTVI